MDDNKVIFSSEFEGSGMKKGVDEGVSHLTKLKTEIEAVKRSTSEYNKEISANNRLISSLNTEIIKNADNVKLQNELIKQSTPIIRASEKANEDLTKKIINNRVELDKLNKHQAEFKKTTGFIGEEITAFGRKAGRAGIDLAIGFGGALLGVAIPTIAKFAESILESINPVKELSENQKILNSVFQDAGKGAASQIVQLDAYKAKLNDLNLPAAERIKIAKEYNKVADETNQIDLKQINNLELINTQIEKQNKLVIQRAISTAALSKLTDTASKVVETELKLREELRSSNLTEEQARKGLTQEMDKQLQLHDKINKTLDDGIVKNGKRIKPIVDEIKTDQIGISQSLRNALLANNRSKFELEEQTKLLSPLLSVDGLTTKAGQATKKEKKKPEIVNEFERRLLDLKKQLADITEKTFEDTDTIRAKFAAGIDKQFAEIDRAIKEKKLTGAQGDILKSYIKRINDISLNEELNVYGKKRREALEKISDEITALQLDLSTKRIAAIRDEFERERLLIDENYKKTIKDLAKRQRDMQQAIQDNKLLSDTEKNNASFALQLVFGDLLTEAGASSERAKADLAFKKFEKLVQEMTDTFDEALTKENENTTRKIVEAAKLYMKGAISYEEFEKRKTKAVREGVHERNLLLIQEAKIRIQALKDEFDILEDGDPNKKKIGKQLNAARNALTGLERADAEGQAGDKKKAKDDAIKKIVAYTQAIGSLANEVIGFWAKVNEAEQKQIERSIALQEKRVAAAQRIAERGNAEYLRQEEDRLTQLNIKQQNAAKKQLAINAVLQASQALVAFVSALAKGAEVGGALGAIASAAAVVGLLASGYAIVKSLQEQSPKFFKGTKKAERRNGEQAGRDTIMAMINEGEAIIPTETNKEYHPTVEAVYDKKIPASVLNEFVKSYGQTKTPKVDYNRIGESSELKINSDGKLVGILADQTKEMRETREVMESVDNRLKHFGVNMSMDKEGIVLAITNALDKRKISSKA